MRCQGLSYLTAACFDWLVLGIPEAQTCIRTQVLKTKSDYEWDMGEVVHTLTNRSLYLDRPLREGCLLRPSL